MKDALPLLDSKSGAIGDALPRGINADQWMASARTAATYCEASPASIVVAIMKAAQMGLWLAEGFGHAYLVPYKGQASLIIGYRGYIDLALRSPSVLAIDAHIVQTDDEFVVEYGTEPKIVHRPKHSDSAPISHAYAVAWIRNAPATIVVMTLAEIRAVATNSPIWRKHEREMTRKTPVRRLAKYLPMNPSLGMAFDFDDDRYDPDVLDPRGTKRRGATLEIADALGVSIPDEDSD